MNTIDQITHTLSHRKNLTLMLERCKGKVNIRELEIYSHHKDNLRTHNQIVRGEKMRFKRKIKTARSKCRMSKSVYF